jgi:hypothetical protein
MGAPHHAAESPPDEPVTPGWLTGLGAALFAVFGAWYVYSASTPAEGADGASKAGATVEAKPAEAKPAAAPLPKPRPGKQPMLGDDIFKKLNAPAGH